MCSILGIIQKDSWPGLDPPALLGRMLALTKMRGPDDSCIECVAPGIFLASNRLSIIDLSANGRMPLANGAGTRWIVFNGELYNYQELRDQLQQAGYVFHSGSDTEVVLHAYEAWGPSCVDRFNGMFAFAIWDGERRQLFLGRDRFGIKPLYFYENDRVLLFSSDIRPLLLFPGVSREIDAGALSAFLHLRFVPGTRSIFKAIHKLGLGETRTWDQAKGHSTSRVYWRPEFHPSDRPLDELTATLYSKLEAAVRHSLVGDVPIGILLSGGIDSAAVVAMVHRLQHTAVQTMSSTYRSAGSQAHPIAATAPFMLVNNIEDESYYSDLVAREFGTRHHTFHIHEEEVSAQFDRMVFDLGEPLASVDALGHYLLARHVGSHVKVALTGTGSDELLGGYTNMYFNKERHLLRDGCTPLDYLRLFSDFNNQHLHLTDYLIPELADDSYTYDLVQTVLGRFPSQAYPDERVNELAFFELFFGLAGWELDQADRAYMAASVEVRPVFLDNDFADFALTIPSRYKYQEGQDKWILKQALRGVLPNAVIDRQKFPGLGLPRAWYGKAWFQQRLAALAAHPLPFWHQPALVALLARGTHQQDFEVLYRLVIFETWYRLFVSDERWI